MEDYSNMGKEYSQSFWEEIEQLENIGMEEVSQIISENMSVSLPEKLLLRRIKARDDSIKGETEKKHLLPERHQDGDFFIADGIDLPYVRDDIASMEYPIFALKAGDTRTLRFDHNNVKTVITASAEYGRATIFDKDVWIYCVSKLMQAKFKNLPISRNIRFSTYDFLISTNRQTGGSQYEQFKQSLERLSGTRISTEIETGGLRQADFVGLIDNARVIEEDIQGRTVAVEITLPNWLYRSVEHNEVLAISKDYFRLRKPIDRRIYEIARKHCGNKPEWKISLELLHKKTGITDVLRNFRVAINSLAKADVLPDYHVKFEKESDSVIFSNRDPDIGAKVMLKRANLFN